MRASALLPPCGSHSFVRRQRHPQHPLRIRCTTPACRQPRYRALRCRRHASARSNNSSPVRRQHLQQQQSQVPRRARIRITAPMFLTLPQVAPPHALPLRTCPQACCKCPARLDATVSGNAITSTPAAASLSRVATAHRASASALPASSASAVPAPASRVAVATAIAIAIARVINIAHRHWPPRRTSPSASTSTSL